MSGFQAPAARLCVINRRRCPVVERLVGTLPVVILEILPQPGEHFFWGFIPLQVDIFIFDRTPQAFYEDVVERPAAPIHREGNPRRQEATGKTRIGNLPPWAAV